MRTAARWRFGSTVSGLTLGFACALGCAQHGGDAGTATNGGVSASNGTSPNGGATSSNGGANPSDGGVTSTNGGATPSNGGANPSAGAPNHAGGTSSSSGTSSSGAGRTSGAGGASARAGASPGGETATAGRSSSTGGAPATAGSTSSTGGATSSGGAGNTSCPQYDAAHPLTTLTLTGNLGTHDPSLIAAGDTYYLFQTGTGLPTKTSTDLLAWKAGAPVFSTNPAWIAQAVSGVTDLWAPDISFFGNSYHLYYAASTFGSNTSCIGHATRASLTSGAWSDQGSVICSGSGDNWNALDPNVILDDDGTPWLAFGSFWGGIQLQELDATGVPTSAKPAFIAARPSAGGALEGAFIVHACGYYYLFVSWDHCCDSPWNYNIRVGRSASVGGPYADKTGKALLDGGGTLLVAGNDTWTAPGHNAVIITPNGAYNVYHALDANHANPTLRIAELAWDDDGWPVSAGP